MPEAAPFDDLPWTRPGWLEAAVAWTRDELERLGRPATGDFELVHQRPWSAFARIPTSGGVVYFKAPAPEPGYEAILTAALAERHPDVVLRPLAIHPSRGWMLLPHYDEPLRARILAVDDLRLWPPILRRYGRLQIETAGWIPGLLDIGVPDRRLDSLPTLFDALLEDHEALRLDRPGGLSRDEHRRLEALRPRLAEEGRNLASFGIPETLVHEEIHDANVLLGDDGPRIIDWSDSCLGHPFYGLLVILRHAAFRRRLPEADPAIRALQEAYLEAWRGFGDMEDLRRAAAIAYRLGMVVRSLAYRDTLGFLPESYRIEIDNTSGWLQDFLEVETSR